VRGTTNVGTLAERSRLPLLTSLANLHVSCKYVGASPREICSTYCGNVVRIVLFLQTYSDKKSAKTVATK